MGMCHAGRNGFGWQLFLGGPLLELGLAGDDEDYDDGTRN